MLLQRAKFFAGDRAKTDLIADGDQTHRLAVGTEHRKRRAAEQAPAARRGEGIDAGLRAGDGDASSGNAFSRSGEAWHDKFERKIAEIRKARSEAEKVGVVGPRSMQFNDAFTGEGASRGYWFEVRSKFTAIADGDFDDL